MQSYVGSDFAFFTKLSFRYAMKNKKDFKIYRNKQEPVHVNISFYHGSTVKHVLM